MAKSKKQKIGLSFKFTVARVIVFVLLAVVLGVSLFFTKQINSFLNKSKTSDVSADLNSGLVVTFIDVEQGDATLIEAPNGERMLIDSGSKQQEASRQKLTTFLESHFEENNRKLDYLVLTHSHEDHSGNMDYIFEFFEIETVARTKENSTASKTYANFLDLIALEGSQELIFHDGLEIAMGEVKLEFLPHNKESYSNKNNYSPIMVLSFDGKKICMTGDAEAMIEKEVASIVPACDVLKLGHHGSDTSSSIAFLNAVLPKNVVISVGKNDYGHPVEEILERVQNLSTHPDIYRTDKNQNIYFVMNSSVTSSAGYAIVCAGTPEKVVISWLYICGGLFVLSFVVCFVAIDKKEQ